MKQSSEISVETRENHEPSNLFNGMLHPLIPHTIRGAIWYQGEANTVNFAEYANLFSGMIEDWRAYWGIGISHSILCKSHPMIILRDAITQPWFVRLSHRSLIRCPMWK